VPAHPRGFDDPSSVWQKHDAPHTHITYSLLGPDILSTLLWNTINLQVEWLAFLLRILEIQV
jgi:hypothetical protein